MHADATRHHLLSISVTAEGSHGHQLGLQPRTEQIAGAQGQHADDQHGQHGFDEFQQAFDHFLNNVRMATTAITVPQIIDRAMRCMTVIGTADLR